MARIARGSEWVAETPPEEELTAHHPVEGNDMSQSKNLREQRAKLVTDAQAILRQNVISAEDRKRFDKMMSDADVMKDQIDQMEARASVDADAREGRRTIVDKYDARYESSEERAVRRDFQNYLVTGDVSPALQKRRAQYRDTDSSGQAAGSQSISYTAGAAGGYFVPAGFVYDVDVAAKYYAPLMNGSAFRILETATGAVLPYPTSNDTTQSASLLAENTQAVEDPITMGQVTFGAFKYTSKVVRVSLELLQDSAFDFSAFLTDQFGIRFGRAYERDFTTGAGGGNAPTGILTALNVLDLPEVIAQGANANSGNAGDTGSNSIGTVDLTALEHSVDPTYRSRGKWMFHDTTLRQLKQLLDKFGRPIWLPGIAVNAPDTLYGYPYVINQQIPTIAPNAPTVLFGDLSKFIIRKVREMSVLRLVERYADYGQVGFIAFSRVDSNLVDAGTHPINQLIMHS
jgi:HK97 family phage major capsid protein